MHPPQPTSHKWPRNSQTNHSMPHHWPSILILECSSRRWDTRKHRRHLGHYSYRMHQLRPTSHKRLQKCQNNQCLPRHWPSILPLECSSRRWDTRKHRQHPGHYSYRMHQLRPTSHKRLQKCQNNHSLPRCWPSVRHLVRNSKRWGTRIHRRHLGHCSSQ